MNARTIYYLNILAWVGIVCAVALVGYLFYLTVASDIKSDNSKPACFFSDREHSKGPLSLEDVRSYGIDFYKICKDFDIYPEEFSKYTIFLSEEGFYGIRRGLGCQAYANNRVIAHLSYMLLINDTTFKIYNHDDIFLYECDSGFCEYGGLSTDLAYMGCE